MYRIIEIKLDDLIGRVDDHVYDDKADPKIGVSISFSPDTRVYDNYIEHIDKAETSGFEDQGRVAFVSSTVGGYHMTCEWQDNGNDMGPSWTVLQRKVPISGQMTEGATQFMDFIDRLGVDYTVRFQP